MGLDKSALLAYESGKWNLERKTLRLELITFNFILFFTQLLDLSTVKSNRTVGISF